MIPKNKIQDEFIFKLVERGFSNLSYIFTLDVNHENLTIECYVLYVINMHTKFLLNQILFTIRSINLFFIHNFKLQKF